MQLAFRIPHPAPPGGGSSFNAGLLPALRALGHTVSEGDGPGTPVIDGLLLPELADRFDALLARDPVVVVHHVSAAAGRDPEARDRVQAIERRLLPQVRRVVATSQPVADRLAAEFGVAAPLLLHPGLPTLPRAPGGPGCRLLAAGVLTPRKGNDRLLAALSRLTDLDWTLDLAGDSQRDPVHATALAAAINEHGLQSRAMLHPDPDAATLDRLWQAADLVVSATAWEGWPATLAEALRRGLPIVAPRLPGIEAIVPDSAAILYGTDDPATFGKCLRRAIFDRTLRTELADAAWTAGRALPDWAQQARAFETILKG